MRRLGRLFALPREDRALLLVALPLLWGVRLSLWILPFRVVRRGAKALGRRPSGSGDGTPGQAERIGWAVGSAARFAPDATCLAQALAAEVLLERRGHTPTVRMGVVKDELGKLTAHAWVESAGRVVIGDHDLDRFTTLEAVDRPV